MCLNHPELVHKHPTHIAISVLEARCVEVVCVSCGWFKHIEPHRTYTMLLFAGDPRSLLQQLMAAKTGSRTAVTSYSPVYVKLSGGLVVPRPDRRSPSFSHSILISDPASNVHVRSKEVPVVTARDSGL